jgi:FMN phosphatase YigB (HAD superfamily)
MTCEVKLIEALQAARNKNFIVLATDNMDCFCSQATAIRDVRSTFDAILASPETGVLKSDSVLDFFGPWLLRHKLNFRDALLIDDSASTCEEFQRVGGQAVLVEGLGDALQGLRSWAELETDRS